MVHNVPDYKPRARRATAKPLELEPIYAFENRWADRSGAKDAAIRAEFDVSTIRYHQVLQRLIRTPEALKHDPILTNRLLRISEERSRDRAERRFTRRTP
jgi:hypothetical protein